MSEVLRDIHHQNTACILSDMVCAYITEDDVCCRWKVVRDKQCLVYGVLLPIGSQAGVSYQKMFLRCEKEVFSR